MGKPVKDKVSNMWAKTALRLLDGNYHDITTLLTELLAATTAAQQELKTIAAQNRLGTATRAVEEWLKYGWQYGINGKPPPRTKPARIYKSRRLALVCATALSAGAEIGARQRRKYAASQPTTLAAQTPEEQNPTQ